MKQLSSILNKAVATVWTPVRNEKAHKYRDQTEERKENQQKLESGHFSLRIYKRITGRNKNCGR